MAPAQVISVKDLPPEVLGEAAPPVGGGNGGVPAPAALPHAPAPLAEEGLGRLAVPVSALAPPHDTADRKSTRLNSSHLVISYAVFCLKKKKPRYVSGTVAHADKSLPSSPTPSVTTSASDTLLPFIGLSVPPSASTIPATHSSRPTSVA